MKTFRAENYVRYDFKWYGFGYRTEYNAILGTQLRIAWVNSYRTAPLAIRWLTGVGWCSERPDRRRINYTGSQRYPWAHWYLSLGRLVLTGDSPRWLQVCKEKQRQRYWERMDGNYPG